MPAAWLEDDKAFEGVGAHRLNPRYDPIDEPEPQPSPLMGFMTPRLKMVSLISAGVTRLDGFDGSHYNLDAGPVDYNALSAGTWWLAWKSSQSILYKDPTYQQAFNQYNRFEQFFGYHWLSSTRDPEQQAAWFIKCQGPDLPTKVGGMGDFEEDGITVDKCLGFMEYWEARRKRPMLNYTGLYVAGGTIWNDERMWEGKYGIRPAIVAAYVTEASLKSRLALQHRKTFDGWQFSSSGPVPGITGRADKDRIDNKPVFAIAAGISAAPPTPAPVPPPTQGDSMSVLDTPQRVWDSRPGSAQGGNGRHGTGETFLVDIHRFVEIPANAKGVIVNLTVLEAEGDGYLSAWGQGGRPGTSNINYIAWETRANCAVVPLAGLGINVYTSKACNVIVDVQGFTT